MERQQCYQKAGFPLGCVSTCIHLLDVCIMALREYRGMLSHHLEPTKYLLYLSACALIVQFPHMPSARCFKQGG